MRSSALRVLVVPALVLAVLSALTAAPTPADAAPGHHRPAHAGAAPELTLQLRDLFVARTEFGIFDRMVASAILARPTDGSQDPQGDGYPHGSTELCGSRICVHYVRSGADAPPSTGWVRHVLHTMGSVWNHEVDDLGFRRPPSDGKRGGDGRFDVYLTDLGARGLYGYCAPETRVKGQPMTASGYCVLDNDFSKQQYGAPRQVSLEVTAAHEFFHAIQFGYDFRADPWLMESTAVWMEESYADSADDNRRYLPYGDVHRPGVPLDSYSTTGLAQYGNWAFWEYLTQRYGDGLIRQVWNHVDARKGAPADSSVAALSRVLNLRTGTRSGLADTLASYAVANLDPATSYPEGKAWPRATYAGRARMRHARGQRTLTVHVDHLAAQNLLFRPPTSGDSRLLQLTVHGPRRRARAIVTVRRVDGTTAVRRVVLAGTGVSTVNFTPGRVASVVLTLVNGSARYTCDRGTLLSCGGTPRDDDMAFTVDAAVVPPPPHPKHAVNKRRAGHGDSPQASP
ncbi:MAG TPA: MXAN_6640 family putative metalloprotease [Nocardioides sp.]|nr:MXAN_6640 family putative metalloprotease [Nocardioides sp.]